MRNLTAILLLLPLAARSQHTGGIGSGYSLLRFVAPQAIATGTVTGPICAGSAVSVPFTVEAGVFNPGNVFTAQLSDAGGGFAAPTAIGSISGTSGGAISAIVPAGTVAGSGYRIRVVSTDPVVPGTNNGQNIAITAPPLWYADADDDGFGAGAPVQSCSQPVDHVANNFDCNDTNASIGSIGMACDDGDAGTVNDVLTVACICQGTSNTVHRGGIGSGYDVLGIIPPPQITTGPATGPLCAGDSVNVSFAVSGNFNPGNAFTAQLSDAAGSFASPTSIGSASGTTSGTITTVIPAGTPAGSGYRIRMVGSDPVIIGTDNGTDIGVGIPLTWYADADGDTYGDLGNSLSACTQPPGHVLVAGDCDDSDPLANPAATELCNGLDDDCDGTTDEGCPPPQLVINEVDYDNAGTGASPEPYADRAEWIELKNIGATAVNLAGVQLELVNGNGGGASIYRTIVLPSSVLPAGDYYVIGNNADIPNIDLVVTPGQNLIQNGSPDAIGLRNQPGGTLLDAVSYEGSAGAPYVEGTGAGTLGADMDHFLRTTTTIARYPDGQDTNNNSADLRIWCATPGASNSNADADGDLVPACVDNCPAAANPDQLDINVNGVGDACEAYPCIVVPGHAEQEPNGTPATASWFCNNSFVATASIATVGDQDHFYLGDHVAGSLIFASIDCNMGGGHFVLAALDQIGQQFGISVEEGSPGCPFGARFTALVAPGGPIYLRVNEAGNNATIASYTLSAAVLPPPATATPETTTCNDLYIQAQGGSDYFLSAPLTASDLVDHYSFQGFAGERVVLVTSSPSPVLVFLLVDLSGEGSMTFVGSLNGSMGVLDLQVSGTYIVRVANGDYVLAIERPYAQELINGVDDNCDGVVDEQCPILVQARVALEGPYNSATGLMGNAMQTNFLLPFLEPYTALGYQHAGGGGGETPNGPFAAQSVVDWVLLELRNAANPAVVVASRSAFLLSNGWIVDMDALAPVSFDAPSGNYYLAVRHRNHLGAMTSAPIALSPAITTVDFTLPATSTFGTNARKSITGTFPAQALWSGDVTFSGQLKYTGSFNDRDPILQAIGGTTPTATLTGQYRQEDVNLDGTVKYTGSANDRDPILLNIGGAVPTAVRNAQLP